jgi:hypothetical protein
MPFDHTITGRRDATRASIDDGSGLSSIGSTRQRVRPFVVTAGTECLGHAQTTRHPRYT